LRFWTGVEKIVYISFSNCKQNLTTNNILKA
jgi:hypothetical protein